MRVLGLDITEHGVFGVEMDTAFGRFEIRDTHEILFDPSLDPTSINPLSAAQQMVETLAHKTERLVVSVPTEISTFRNLQLATKDRKAIKAALEFELEDDLPFERENMHYDSAIMSATSAGSVIHVGAVKKDSYVAFLNQLTEFGVDPDIITTETWAFRCLMSRMFAKNPNPEPILLIGLEDQKTFFYIHQEHRPILSREVAFGKKHLERFLETRLGASPDEIRNWIQDFGLTGQAEDRVATVIAEALDVLIPEIKQTELSARSTLKSSIEQIYLTGELALMPGLAQWLEAVTQKRVSLFRPLSQLSPSQLNYSDVSEVRFARALALAMSVIPADKISPINLRKGEFAKLNATDSSIQDMALKILPYVALVTIVFATTKVIEYQYYQGKLAESEETLKRSVKNYFGGVSDSAVRTYMADTTKLKKTIQTDLSKEREMAKLFAQNPNSPIDFLKNLSNKVGKDIVLDMIDFNVGADSTEPYKDDRPLKTSLTVLISSAQSLAKLSELLEKNYNLKKGASDEITKEGRKFFKVEFTGIIASTKGGR